MNKLEYVYSAGLVMKVALCSALKSLVKNCTMEVEMNLDDPWFDVYLQRNRLRLFIPFYLLLLIFLLTTNASSFRLVGADSDTLLFLTGLEFDSSMSFFLLTLDGLLSTTPFTWLLDFVLELCCDICLVLRGFFGDSKLEVPLSGVGPSSGKASNSDTSLFAARPFRGLGDDLAVDDFSVDTNGERRSGLFGGEASFCRLDQTW